MKKIIKSFFEKFSIQNKSERGAPVGEMSWDRFLEYYLNYCEFMIVYEGIEYHLAFHDEGEKVIAEFNVGTKETGYENFEYSSQQELLENAKIAGKTIQEMWEFLTVH